MLNGRIPWVRGALLFLTGVCIGGIIWWEPNDVHVAQLTTIAVACITAVAGISLQGHS